MKVRLEVTILFFTVFTRTVLCSIGTTFCYSPDARDKVRNIKTKTLACDGEEHVEMCFGANVQQGIVIVLNYFSIFHFSKGFLA